MRGSRSPRGAACEDSGVGYCGSGGRDEVKVWDLGRAESEGERAAGDDVVLRWDAMRARRIGGVVRRESDRRKLMYLKALSGGGQVYLSISPGATLNGCGGVGEWRHLPRWEN